MPAMRASQSISMLTDTPLSRASRIVAPPLPQGLCLTDIGLCLAHFLRLAVENVVISRRAAPALAASPKSGG
ncbi:hypothetical protein EI534_25795 [Pseudomonas frederiksbergensis]|nr:hypothetical protein [Pseudomonas frederiksbergensis]